MALPPFKDNGATQNRHGAVGDVTVEDDGPGNAGAELCFKVPVIGSSILGSVLLSIRTSANVVSLAPCWMNGGLDTQCCTALAVKRGVLPGMFRGRRPLTVK